MNKKLLKLAQRRENLVLEAEAQRAQLTQIVDTWRPALSLADRGVAAIDFIKKHPVMMAGTSAILLKVLRPSRIGKWLGRGLVAWQMVSKFRSKFLA